ncbi:MAG: YqaA family protein [Erysipelotrichaceae bacterium]
MLELLFLFLYAVAKACLPLPSLEVVLIPMVIQNPNNWILISLIGAVGTFVGGAIGYVIARMFAPFVLKHINQKDQEKGMYYIHRYGVLAIFIGGITPLPDFILPYVAGLAKMNFWLFASADAIARLLRSLLVAYAIVVFGTVVDIEFWGTIISVGIIVLLLAKYVWQQYQTRKS